MTSSEGEGEPASITPMNVDTTDANVVDGVVLPSPARADATTPNIESPLSGNSPRGSLSSSTSSSAAPSDEEGSASPSSPAPSDEELETAGGPPDAGSAAAAAAAGAEAFDSPSTLAPNPSADTATSKASGSQMDESADAFIEDDEAALMKKPLKILFLSSDTGGGHRASAESLARQFELLYPGSTYDLLDVVASDGVPPYNSLVSWYSHLGSHPTQWKVVYNVSNSKAFELMADVHLKLMCERAVRRRILSYSPDVVVSVHPLMCNVPALACQKIEKKSLLGPGRQHLPMFTVVTDLGSAHCLWFANKVDRMYIASDAVGSLAKSRGKVPDEKLVKIGLPIRHDFAVQAERLGERWSGGGREYQRSVRVELGLPRVDHCRTVLVMGGGEGVGSLSDIVNYLYVVLVTRGIDAQILVVCGRNDRLRADLAQRDWDAVLGNYRRLRESGPKVLSTLAFDGCLYPRSASSSSALGSGLPAAAGCIETMGVTQQLRRILSSTTLENALATALPESAAPSEAPSRAQSEGGDGTGSEFSFGGTGVKVESVEVGLEEDGANENRDEDKVVDDGEEKEEPVKSGGGGVEAREEEENVETAAAEAAAVTAGTTAPATTTPAHAISEDAEVPGTVTVLGLGFVTRMAEYMVASDVLVSKAGPGTIAEAASLSLPVMLTSFLPGQEEGNVDFVVDNKFGAYCPDSDPTGIAEQVAGWFLEESKLRELSKSAAACGRPHAAADIVKDIGEETLRWRRVNARRAAEEAVRVAEEEAARDASSAVAEKDAAADQQAGEPINNQRGGIRRIASAGGTRIEASIQSVKSLYTTLSSNVSSTGVDASSNVASC